MLDRTMELITTITAKLQEAIDQLDSCHFEQHDRQEFAFKLAAISADVDDILYFIRSLATETAARKTDSQASARTPTETAA